jgi:hypothetical protein
MAEATLIAIIAASFVGMTIATIAAFPPKTTRQKIMAKRRNRRTK